MNAGQADVALLLVARLSGGAGRLTTFEQVAAAHVVVDTGETGVALPHGARLVVATDRLTALVHLAAQALLVDTTQTAVAGLVLSARLAVTTDG